MEARFIFTLIRRRVCPRTSS